MKITMMQAMVTSFIIWMLMGSWLLYKGLFFLYQALFCESKSGFLFFTDRAEVPFVFVGLGLILSALLGLFKGRFVMKKAAAKMVARLRCEPVLIPILKVYPLSYVFIILLMMSMGIALKYSGLSLEIRGYIDVAVGVALLAGAREYGKYAWAFFNKK